MAIKIRKKVGGKDKDEAPEEGLEGAEGVGAEGDGESPLGEEELPPEDTFVSGSVTAAKWVTEHKKKIFIALGVILALVIGYAIFDSVMRSRALAQAKSVNDIIDVYPQYSAQESTSFSSQGFALRKSYNADGRSEMVLQRAEAAIAEYGDSDIAGEAHLLAGVASQRLGELKKAESHLSTSEGTFQAGDPTKIFALQAKAALLVDQARLDEALTVYQQIHDFDPKHFGAFALFEKARLYEKKGEAEKAADAYAELIAKYETDPIYVPEARKRITILVPNGEERIDTFKAP